MDCQEGRSGGSRGWRGTATACRQDSVLCSEPRVNTAGRPLVGVRPDFQGVSWSASDLPIVTLPSTGISKPWAGIWHYHRCQL